ncbi:hypothetical protein NQ315_002460 [Exocentrus adspersus]|uniref:RNase H type-1 domain-containing protein n=1 Tax=Exocentrus adspersus TaxID=1586481 RepID=A0AAV8V868_9CUCU|nr:hypothetical protein NQ315_002460 [Exocentrus adspersus]
MQQGLRDDNNTCKELLQLQADISSILKGGPISIIAKLLIQQLWQANLGWDEEVPVNICTGWRKFSDNLTILNDIKIARYVLIPEAAKIELHGFSDAYGACIYIRSKGQGSNYGTQLCAKSRVAPLQRLSLPRLELCGALLLANLIKKVLSAVHIAFDICGQIP